MQALNAFGHGGRSRAAAVICALGMLSLLGGRSSGAADVEAFAPRQIELTSWADESLRSTLRHSGLDVADSNAAAYALTELLDPERPPPGLTLIVKVERHDGDPGLRFIEMAVRNHDRVAATVTRAADGSLRFNPGANGPGSLIATEPLRTVPAVLQGPMEDVLYGDPGTTSDAAIILQAARLFAHKLDLTRDLALGQKVRLVFTRKVASDGHIVGPGDLLYAEIDVRDGPARFYRHRRAGSGDIEFVDEAGGELDHALLRTPVDGARITSDFGMRMHPLLGYTRMHQGLDFGAPIGSAVLAAADGVVEQERWAGGYGRWIRLRHSTSLETGYGHLSGWASGLREGEQVRQGQVIGYVGSTGLSTGPHLHYEVWEGGHPIDPKSVQGAGRTLLRGSDVGVFAGEKQQIAALLEQQSPMHVAASTPGPGGPE